jgi:CarboxypepD_reg-like domain
MSTNKNSIPYSASDIEKYRKGELSAHEMHDLEHAALDDPFLADAIEGLTEHPPTQQDLTDLQDRLNRKATEQNRRAAIIRIRRGIAFAAAVILLLGIGFTFFYRYPGQPHRTLQPVSGATAKAPVPSVPPAPATVVATPPPATEYKAPEKATAYNVTTTHRHHLPAADAKAAAPPAENRTQPFYAADSITLRTELNKDLAAAIVKQQPANGAYLNFRPYPLVYSGKVVDLQNRPLAGAFLAFNGNYPSGTTTDDRGQFKFSLRPRDSTGQLTVSLVGYDHTSLAVNALSMENQASNVIYLKPSDNADMDEVAVVGYGKKRKAVEAAVPSDSDEKLDTLWNVAAPVIGRQAYLQYLGIAKKKLGLDSTIAGTETVSFIVSRDGTLSSFKIEQSLSPAHDAGIIRLITDGPSWHLNRGKSRVRAAVTVNF